MKIQKLLTVLVLLSAGTAMAAMPSFQKLDTNKDKLLSKQEVASALSGVDFTNADKDKDGSLNEKEYLALVKKLRTLKEDKS